MTNATTDFSLHPEIAEQRLRRYTPVTALWGEWVILKDKGLRDRVSIRVFEGDLYSLMDDSYSYESLGIRKKINTLTCSWDYLRKVALSDELKGRVPSNWSSRETDLLEEEAEELAELIEDFDGMMARLLLIEGKEIN